eukprot:293036-Rhodomonas_salina.1
MAEVLGVCLACWFWGSGVLGFWGSGVLGCGIGWLRAWRCAWMADPGRGAVLADSETCELDGGASEVCAPVADRRRCGEQHYGASLADDAAQASAVREPTEASGGSE